MDLFVRERERERERETSERGHLRPTKLRSKYPGLRSYRFIVRTWHLLAKLRLPRTASRVRRAVTSSMKTALPSYEATALSLGQVQRHASRTHATATRVHPTGAAVRAAPTTLRARQEHRQTTRPHCSGGRNSLSEILSTPIIIVPSLNNLSAVRYLMYNVESIAISEFNLRMNNGARRY